MSFNMGDRIFMLDAWGKNPTRGRVVKVTPTGGVIMDDARGVRHFAPPGSERARPDLGAPPREDLWGPLH